jgi:hypothetical protein
MIEAQRFQEFVRALVLPSAHLGQQKVDRDLVHESGVG